MASDTKAWDLGPRPDPERPPKPGRRSRTPAPPAPDPATAGGLAGFLAAERLDPPADAASALAGLLDLTGGDLPAGPPAAPALVAEGPAGPPPGPTVLQVDPWVEARGKHLADTLKRFGEEGADAAADFFGAAFEPAPAPRPEGCVDRARERFVKELLDSPDYASLHKETELDAEASELAAAHFADGFARMKKDCPPPKPPGKGGRGRPGPTPGEAAAAEAAADVAAMRAAGRAAREAKAEVAAYRDGLEACGLGAGGGGMDPARAAEVYRRVRADPAVRRIVELAGAFRRHGQGRRRQRTSHGLDDVLGVTPGGEVGRLVGSELGRLAHPALRAEAVARLVERQCLCRELAGVEPVAKGPVIVTIDESGSMHGEKAEAAKGLGLAMAWLARRQNRWAALVAYSGDSGHRLLPLPPGRWDEAAVLDFLSRFIGAGSDLDVPLRELPDFYRQLGAPRGKTDVLMVTDAVCHVPPAVADRFRAWKAEVAARVTAVVVGGAAAGDLPHVCDEVFRAAALTAGEAAVDRALDL